MRDGKGLEGRRMSDEQAQYSMKVKRAAQILLFQRHRQPGVKGWELRKALGKDYMKVIGLLEGEMEKIGLRVKILYEVEVEPKKATEEQLEKARFYVTLTNPMSATDMIMTGWRVDEVAVLAVSIAYIMSKQGKAPRKEIEKILKEKFPSWQTELSLDRCLRRGYLVEGEDGTTYIGWRTRAEIDQRTLQSLILHKETRLPE